MDQTCFNFLTRLNHITNMPCQVCILPLENNKSSFLLCKRLHKQALYKDNSLSMKKYRRIVFFCFFKTLLKYQKNNEYIVIKSLN